MTYFGFLALFLVLPLIALGVITFLDRRSGRELPASLRTWPPAGVIAAHVLLAVIYTTPWDNYLVATGVWWYDPNLVSGVVLGWVPLEEYLFFVLQTILAGLWLLFLARRLRIEPMAGTAVAVSFLKSPARVGSAILGGAIWVSSVFLLASGWQPGTYLGLILVWALPPILLQLIFGADILWHRRHLILAALVPLTLYLCVGDALAIRSGTWTIDPAQSTGILLFGLPLEEALFFLVTNVLVVFGVTLVLSKESHQRAPDWLLDRLSAMSPKSMWPKSMKPSSVSSAQARQKPSGTPSLIQPQSWPLVGSYHLLVYLWVMGMSAIPIFLWVLGDRWLPPMVTLCVLLQAGAVTAILWQHWGARRTLRAMAIVLVSTWAIEWVGSSTGFPFGDYAYTETLQPQLAHVPLHIPPAWWMMLPPSWAIAAAITRGRTGVGFVVISALAFTAWDLFLDPQMVTWGYWVWQEPGGYFGIPWSNYFGWFLSALLVTALVRPVDLPVLPLSVIYAITLFLSSIGLALFWDMPGPAIAGAAGMGFFLGLAIYRNRGQTNLLDVREQSFTASSILRQSTPRQTTPRQS